MVLAPVYEVIGACRAILTLAEIDPGIVPIEVVVLAGRARLAVAVRPFRARPTFGAQDAVLLPSRNIGRG